MNTTNIPDFQKKQQILYIDHRPAKDIIAHGDNYLKAGRIFDAIDAYQRANYAPGLEKIREIAESTGDVMLFQQAMKALGRVIPEDEWNRVGQQALSLGKYTFSLFAFEKSGNESMRERVKTLIQTQGKESIL